LINNSLSQRKSVEDELNGDVDKNQDGRSTSPDLQSDASDKCQDEKLRGRYASTEAIQTTPDAL
jgi:hypothetical protein